MLLFRRVLARPPPERAEPCWPFSIISGRGWPSGELKAAEIAGNSEGDVSARAAWTLAARAILNTDEAVTKE